MNQKDWKLPIFEAHETEKWKKTEMLWNRYASISEIPMDILTWRTNKTGLFYFVIFLFLLGESRGGAPPCKDTSWWNEQVKTAIKIKRDSYRDLKKNCDGVSFERYKLAKKEAKKAVQNVGDKVYKKVYEKLNTKEVEKDIYRIVRIKERDERLIVL